MDYLTFLTEGSAPRITKGLQAAVTKWTKNSSVWPLSKDDIDRLLLLPVRPTAPVVLYRGLLFSKADNDFAHAVEMGMLTVSVPSLRPTSWTADPTVATGFARNRDVGDNNVLGQVFNKTQWKNSAIDGEYGVVLKITASPNQVICGLSYLGLENEFEHENEFILQAGTYAMKIVQAFDVNGEIDF